MDTTLGAGGAPFPPTTSGFLELFRASPGRDVLEATCRRYWKPIYAYIRLAWAKPADDAKDLTQAFLVYLLEEGALDTYERGRGGFRAFLKTLLRRFVGHDEAALRTLKRGGGRIAIPLDEAVLDPAAEEPSAAFDRVWRDELVHQAIGRVRARCEAAAFAIYEAFDLGAPALRPTYAELAARHGLELKDVKRLLFDVREKVRGEIRAVLAALTGDDRELEEEWNGLLGR
jgi:DNA-directed RNA polymerase specialized sigma24 family protein